MVGTTIEKSQEHWEADLTQVGNAFGRGDTLAVSKDGVGEGEVRSKMGAVWKGHLGQKE